MAEFFDYVVCVDKNSGGNDVHLCYAPYMSFIEVGDIVVINPPDYFKDMLLKKEDSALKEKGNVVGLYAPYNCITSTDIEDLQCKVKDEFQSNAIWIMHPETMYDIRNLKDNSGNYLLQNGGPMHNPPLLLGKPVYVFDNMPKLEAGKTVMYYGDMRVHVEVISVGTISTDEQNKHKILTNLKRIESKIITQKLKYKHEEETIKKLKK